MVRHSADDRAVPRLRQRPRKLVGVGTLVRPLGQLGEAEVEDFDQPIRSQHDVFRLDVAMHDPGLMCGSQRRRDLHRNGERLVQRHLASLTQDLPRARSRHRRIRWR